MNDAPERIWLLPFDGEQRCWCDDPDPSGLGHEADATEYIRADLATQPDPRVKALVEALRDMVTIAKNDRWDAALTGRDMILQNALTALARITDTGGKADE